MAGKLFTAIATCKICGLELNRATHVPEGRELQIITSAPLVAICPVRGHNSFSDCNIGAKLEWFEEGVDTIPPEPEAKAEEEKIEETA